MNNSDMPAMPLNSDVNPHTSPTGLTKREYFAGLAMQGICGNSNFEPTTEQHYNNAVCDAVCIADALLKQLESTEDK